MPSLSEFLTNIGHAIIYEIIALGAIHLMAVVIWNRIKTYREILALWCGGLVLLTSLIFAVGQRPQVPNLIGGLQNVNASAWNNGRDTVATIEMSIVNSGSMQTVIKNWNIEMVISGNKYKGYIIDMPEPFKMTAINAQVNEPTELIFHKEDLIAFKAMTPIQPGGMLPGILFVLFERIEPDIFKNGSEITVTFEDAFSNIYAAVGRPSSQRPERISTLPGLHTEMVCKAPPDLLNSMQPPAPAMTPIPGVPLTPEAVEKRATGHGRRAVFRRREGREAFGSTVVRGLNEAIRF